MKKPNILPLLFCAFLYSNCFAQNSGDHTIDSLYTELNKYKSTCNYSCLKDSNKVKIIHSISERLYINYTDSAITLCSEALSISIKINWIKGIARSNSHLGLFYLTIGNYTQSLKFSQEGLRYWEKHEKMMPEVEIPGLQKYKAAVYGNIGQAYTHQGFSNKADEFLDRSIQTYKLINDSVGIVKQLFAYGKNEYFQGNFQNSLRHFLEAKKIVEKSSNDAILLSSIHAEIGSIYSKTGNLTAARENMEAALAISRKEGLKLYEANALSKLAGFYYNSNDYSNALIYSKEAIEIYKQSGHKIGEAFHLNLIGSIYKEQQNNMMAELRFQQALDIYIDEGDEINQAILSGNLGQIYLSKKDYTKAKKYFDSSLQLAIKTGSWDDILEGNLNLTDYYKQKGDYKKAFEQYQLAEIAKDSLFNQEKAEEITRIEMQYDYDKKESALKAEHSKNAAESKALLEKQQLVSYSIAGGTGIIFISSIFSFFFYKRKRDAEQKQKETFLSLQVSETEMKALRSQMNPHFIFNALQSIQSFLLKQKSEEANMYLLKFSKLMRAVLENSQYSEVSLKKDLQAIELYMQLESIRLPYPFTYEFHIDKSIDTETTSIPPLILQPFVENAIWHGLQQKPESGHINIFISKQNGALHASVEDNGVGRDMSKAVQQPMLLKKQSLGMKLTEERLKILSATKKFQSSFQIIDLLSKDNFPLGTRVDLSLPLTV